MSEDLVAFLRERLDEDEAMAEQAKDNRTGVWTCVETRDGRYTVRDNLGYSVVEYSDVEAEPWFTSPHITRHDPARVLAEIAAKRAAVDEHEAVMESLKDYDPDDGSGRAMVSSLRGIVVALAAVYADHPDYRPEWAPNA